MKTIFVRRVVVSLAAIVCLPGVLAASNQPTADGSPAKSPANLAIVAQPSSSYVSGDTKLAALNDGFDPAESGEWRAGHLRQLEQDWHSVGRVRMEPADQHRQESTSIGGRTARASIRRRPAGCCIGTATSMCRSAIRRGSG